MKKNYILDTNVLLHDPNSLLSFDEHNVLLPIEVIEEIDRFKRESTELGQNARTVSRMLDGLRGETLPEVGERSAAPSDAPQEAPVSPIFIKNPIYGTRCSTVVAVDGFGHGLIVERCFTPFGDVSGETTLSFSWTQ